eukprot:scaffold85946_cov19-Tisochrysis_lutea.AAC.1
MSGMLRRCEGACCRQEELSETGSREAQVGSHKDSLALSATLLDFLTAAPQKYLQLCHALPSPNELSTQFFNFLLQALAEQQEEQTIRECLAMQWFALAEQQEEQRIRESLAMQWFGTFNCHCVLAEQQQDLEVRESLAMQWFGKPWDSLASSERKSVRGRM